MGAGNADNSVVPNSVEESLRRFGFLILFLACPQPAAAECTGPDSLRCHAREWFQRYVALERAFDPRGAEMIADDARIVLVRRYPNGRQRTLELTGARFKVLFRAALPAARARRDANHYFKVTYTIGPRGVRIRGLRHSTLKHYSEPFSLVVAPDRSGPWLLRESCDVSRP